MVCAVAVSSSPVGSSANNNLGDSPGQWHRNTLLLAAGEFIQAMISAFMQANQFEELQRAPRVDLPTCPDRVSGDSMFSRAVR